MEKKIKKMNNKTMKRLGAIYEYLEKLYFTKDWSNALFLNMCETL